ncbi:isoleucine--tRNA ligase [Rubrivirga sp.]|uniref:isoleucine--tRNA ligase n=1 Tax=Rubrivirga sp. TaxID=1885344 RepID=UPI003B521808
MPYPEVDRFDPVAVEEAVLAKWDAEDTFRQSLAVREGTPHFVFYEGPPTANGKPGIHHVMARTIKDLFCRYKTMRGFRVDRKAGWDTHGLPVEIEVEKELGLEGRHAVEEYGVAEYNAACRASVLRYKDLWDDLTVRMGYWVDLEHPYVTFETDYIESVWNLLRRIWDKGLLSKGHKIQWYSPANGTVLSSHEVSLGYKEVQDVSIVVRARLVEEPRTSLLAWTTTPWTVPSNVAMAVGPGIHYVKARQVVEQPDGSTEEEFLIVAKSQVASILKGDYEVVQELTGADLVDARYEPMWRDDDENAGHGAWRVVLADYVTTEDGTGIVHTAPAFGMDDFATGQRYGLPTINPVTAEGRFEDDAEVIGGMWFKDADRVIIRDLAARGLLYREDSYVHNYPHDWRKGTPLMQYPVESWFVRTTEVKDRLVELNKTINWQPEGIGTGRFGAWLDGNVDWAISRMRYWGTPLPIWVSDRDPEQVEVIGSVEELRERAGGTFPREALNPLLGGDGLDLHRPYVDAITWPDGQGGTMRRVPDLLDVWFDSGAMPFAQWHYPFENAERFQANVPADFIAEGVDQTRGWFYTLHAIATLVDDRVAYRNVVVNGLVLDANGEKMSKSKGNAVEPFGAIARHGADPIRWTMMSASPPWEDLRYSDAAVEETTRKFFGTLVNTYRFFATYASLDGYARDDDAAVTLADRTELDRWVLSRLQSTVAEAVDALDAYHPTRAARAVEAFADDLSNWWLRRSRRRFWKEVRGTGYEVQGPDDLDRTSYPVPRTDKQAAYDTLWECLEAVSRLMAPISPFVGEWLYGLLGHDASVHLQTYPEPEAGRHDAELEGRMALARAVTTATLALRNEAGINVRQPLRSLLVVTGAGGVDQAVLRSVENVILDEVNVKALETASADSGVVSKRATPNFKALGRKLGPRMKEANAAIRALDTDAIRRYEAEGSYVLDLPSGPVTLERDDLDVVSEGVAGRVVRQETALDAAGETRVVTVALDTTLDDALRAEGVTREVVNRIQALRKEAGFEVADRIAVELDVPAGLLPFVAANGALAPSFADPVRAETLAESLALSDTPTGDLVREVEITGEALTVGVRRL